MGGGLGHITRFMAFCNTFTIKPILVTLKNDYIKEILSDFALEVFVIPSHLTEDRQGLRLWIIDLVNKIKPYRIIVDAFPGGILGELSGCGQVLKEIEYIARILKLDVYKKRIDGELPHISKIWQVEELGIEQSIWLKELAEKNNIKINRINLDYPVFNVDSTISISDNSWLVVHSGSEQELKELYEYAIDTALLDNCSPNIVVVGQANRPDFLPDNTVYYNVYPVTNLLQKATKVFSGAGFNIMQQMNPFKEKHIVLPFDRPLDDQFLRLKLRK